MGTPNDGRVTSCASFTRRGGYCPICATQNTRKIAPYTPKKRVMTDREKATRSVIDALRYFFLERPSDLIN
jgi:hypothetical protein